MKLRLWEKYGTQFILLIIAVFSWWYIARNLHHDAMFGMIFPLYWIMMIPYGDFFINILNPYMIHEWWIWVEIGIMLFSWMLLFFIFRGIYYFLSSVECLSMWQMFIICIGLGFLFFVLILLPVMDQLDIWWEAWPEMRAPHVPGGDGGLSFLVRG